MRKIVPLIILILGLGALFFSHFYIPKLSSDKGGQACTSLSTPTEALSGTPGTVFAKVFSTYPFNVKNRIFINAGSADGIAEGDAAYFGNVLVGSVTAIFKNYAEVKTVFDPNWRIPVRIGTGEIDALLQGGSMPLVTLVQNEKEMKSGDEVGFRKRRFSLRGAYRQGGGNTRKRIGCI